MLNFIDSFLNRITMYRLMLYFLTCLIVIAAIFGGLGLFPFHPVSILLSAGTLTAACWVANKFFSAIFRVPTNIESVYITAFILTLIVTPVEASAYVSNLPFLLLVSLIAMGSKYFLNWKGKHIFNPAAIALVITFYTVSLGASWWIGDWPMTIFIILGGLLVVRKLQRFDLVLAFLATSLVSALFSTPSLSAGENLVLQIFRSPLFFFACVMLTEPLTSPPKRSLRIMYGVLVGIMATPGFHLGSFYFSAELALVLGNIFSYLVSPKGKHLMKLVSKQNTGNGIYEFMFEPNHKFKFQPGQYLEWTIPHEKPDMRGNRRYFTIASSPTERDLRLGVKFYQQPSTFKQALNALKPGDKILSGQLAGEFVLPPDSSRKLAFIAGGIGITPFRSMIKYLLDKGEVRDIVLFYSNNTAEEIAYREIFDEAKTKFGLKTVYTLTEIKQLPKTWLGKTGFIDAAMLKTEIPDFQDRIFYISGPRSMVTAFKRTLKGMGVPGRNIKVDFFPGFV